jgi:ribosome-binding ATPase YchF (GTP1/OBG family)
MKVGIVGMPNAGKSSLFNALSQAGVEAANYPFTTIEPNMAVVPVKDERLEAVARTLGASEIVPDTIQFHDIAGLVAGAHKGEGLGNQFLANIRETDALLHVVRAHHDSGVVHPDGEVDPARDLETIETELIFADLEQAERRLNRVVRDARSRERAAVAEEPCAAACSAVAVSSRIEAELSELEDEDAAAMREDLGIAESGLTRVVRGAFGLLDLIAFFTAGEAKPAQSWHMRRGLTAWHAAGAIHSDIQRGFVRAEVIGWDSLVDSGGYVGARDRGVLRLEGRDYAMTDGDVITVKFTP